MQNMEEIYKEYFETVKKYLFCLTHNNDIAEELTQETFYKAVKNIHTFKDDCKISVWLCKIAKNTWLDSIKKNKNIKDMADNELFEIESLETTDETVISNQGKLELYKKIQKLDEKTRDVIYLRITGDLNFKEIGDIFNKTENWARITFYRGKQKLKEVKLHERKRM
ncbi:putative RNA polymerase sigma factor [Clostridium sp. CAG:508]|jgi:RNA polymerase sigma factor, sigma-70 family|nr:sigma-70 family RNA polymerase sigma factor [Clostridia bacterium]CDC31072.1 putative RNA polymerase sigma factor [Clostridium sp. CAG:508]